MSGRVDAALGAAAARLRGAGIDEPWREARLLLAAVLDLPMASVLTCGARVMSERERRNLAALVERRAGREPLSRIRGVREFWSLPFRLGAASLDPRPDSETLVGAVLERASEREAAARILDLGTGSGCLLLALLQELPRAFGIGLDRSDAAIATARDNAERLGLQSRCRFIVGDWAASLNGRFDWVLCNPPYIPSAAITGLGPEVRRFDPPLALDGGADGLDAYRRLLPQIPRLLSSGGRLAIEVGDGQAEDVAGLAAEAGLALAARVRDLGGRDRCLVLSPEVAFRPSPSRQENAWPGRATGLGWAAPEGGSRP
jgi:release factor glutamine methyltransferase